MTGSCCLFCHVCFCLFTFCWASGCPSRFMPLFQEAEWGNNHGKCSINELLHLARCPECASHCLTQPAKQPGRLIFSVYSLLCSKKAKEDKLAVEGQSHSPYSFYCMWHVASPKRRCQLEIQSFLQPSVRTKDQGPFVFWMHKTLGSS